MSKQEQLLKLKTELESQPNLPLKEGATRLVFGGGNPETEIYFIGEAPGYWEDQKGQPFVGQAGRLLDELFGSIGIKREEVYISNMVKFRPPNNRDPEPSEIAAFAPFIDREIEIINPKLIVTLGRFSMAKFLGSFERISKVHGQVKTVKWKGKEIVVIPMYHPAAALRSSEVLRQLKEDFQKIPQVLEQVKKQKRLDSDEDGPEQLSLL